MWFGRVRTISRVSRVRVEVMVECKALNVVRRILGTRALYSLSIVLVWMDEMIDEIID